MSRNIPGYYHDPKTGRYFRSIFPHVINEPPPQEEDLAIAPQLGNIPSLLSGRQIGGMKNDFGLAFLKLKTQSLKLDNWKPIVPYSEWPSEIVLLKGDSETIHGLWNISPKRDHNLQVTCRIPKTLNTADAGNMTEIPMGMNVVDFCESPGGVMYIANDLRTGMGKFLWRNTESSRIEEWSSILRRKSAFFCCCYNSVAERFAIGLESSILIENSPHSCYSIRVKGNVHSVQYNETGTILYSGINSGKIVVTDVRAKGHVKHVKLYNIGIDETVLFGQNYLICGNFDGNLCKFDLRVMKKVMDYFGHVHTPKKMPFSVNENLNMMCATGADNVTRLWSLAYENPIKTIVPPDARVQHRAWLTAESLSQNVLFVIQRGRRYHVNI